MGKKRKVVENIDISDIINDIEIITPKRKKGNRSKAKGSAYELKIIKEFTDMGYKGLKSSRSESRNLDNDKIDIAETEDKLPFYVQCKCTMITPNIESIIEDCPRKDRPIVVLWKKQIKKAVNFTSGGEYVLMSKEYFYSLIQPK